MERARVFLYGVGIIMVGLLLEPTTAFSEINLIINTQSGPVQGISVNDGEINGIEIESEQWRGIPYAAPPTGARRWKNPQAPAAWIEVRDGSQFGSHCLQGVSGEGPIDGDEDCLYLNVFRPADYDYENNPPLPVLVHIHGGGNGFGWAEEFVNSWLNQGLIVVTMNYRLGVWGFLAHPLLTQENAGLGSGNWALMDQMEALKWVKNNIAAFGGDPQNVTLSGFSAGAQDALAIMASPHSEGLFQRVAAQATSNWSVYPGPWNTQDRYDHIGKVIFERMGCDQEGDPLACMRHADPLFVQEATTRNGSWEPSYSVDGRLFPKPVIELLRDSGGRVPLLLGSNREEGSPFFIFDILEFFNGELAKGDYTLWTNDFLGPKNGNKARKLFTAEEFGSYTWAFLYLDTDLGFTCPVRDVARANSIGHLTYRYLFTHTLVHDDFLSMLRAFHGVENLFLWNFYNENWYPRDEEEKLLSERMGRYWGNFAKTGDPNGENLPEWPGYDSQTEKMIVLDTEITSLEGGYKNKVCDALGGEVIFPKCTSLCRQFLQGILHLPGWFIKKVEF